MELELIEKTGDRHTDSGKREAMYAFRREEKPEISPELFAWCVCDFFDQNHKNESTVSFREVSVGRGSPGQVFKLPESDLRERLESLADMTGGSMAYLDSASIQQIRKTKDIRQIDILRSVY